MERGESVARGARRVVAVAQVYVGMRYWHPYTEEALDKIKRDDIGQLVILPLYPQFSISTSGSSLRCACARRRLRVCVGRRASLCVPKADARAARIAEAWGRTQATARRSLTLGHPGSAGSLRRACPHLPPCCATPVCARRLLEKLFKEDIELSDLKHTVIPSWYQRKGYVQAMADLIVQELGKFGRPKDVEVFFSAHGVPKSYVEEAGEPPAGTGRQRNGGVERATRAAHHHGSWGWRAGLPGAGCGHEGPSGHEAHPAPGRLQGGPACVVLCGGGGRGGRRARCEWCCVRGGGVPMCR